MFSHIAQVKLSYLGDDINNTDNLPLIDLIEILFLKGLEFANENPQYAKISGFLIMNRDDVYDKIMGENLKVAVKYYESYIENDKSQGRIREDVDTGSLARLIVSLSVQNTTDHFLSFGNKYNFDQIFNDLKSMLYMLKKGIE